MRPIHSASAHPFAPGMRFVTNVIGETMRNCNHVLKDTDDLINKLPRYEVSEDDHFLKIDVRDFFMSGRTQQLNAISTGAAPLAVNGKAGFRRMFKDLLEVLLDPQYVAKNRRSLVEASIVYKVIIGSGMGVISSGAISDVCVVCLCESGFLLDESVRARFHIRAYARFKDDLFFVIGGDASPR